MEEPGAAEVIAASQGRVRARPYNRIPRSFRCLLNASCCFHLTAYDALDDNIYMRPVAPCDWHLLFEHVHDNS